MNCPHNIEVSGHAVSTGIYVTMCGDCGEILRVPRRQNRKPNKSRSTRRTDFGRRL